MASSTHRFVLTLLVFLFSGTRSWHLPPNKPWKSILSTLSIASSLSLLPQITLPTATWSSEISYSREKVQQIPLYTERSANVVPFSDISRGFKLLRPFGFNEFEGAGSGYLVKFSSLFDSKSHSCLLSLSDVERVSR